MEELLILLEHYLKVLNTGEIDATAYQQLLNTSMFSLTIVLRLYFGEDPFAGQQITILEPDA